VEVQSRFDRDVVRVPRIGHSRGAT
jgi:hypothetical protein